MLSHSHTVRIRWGDCDPAGIVFYPRYFGMFDHATALLFERATGLSKHQMYERYTFDGYPVVETRARFIFPTRFGDDVEIETVVTELGRSSVKLVHRLRRDGALAVEATETRVWVVRDPTTPGGFKAHPIPAGVVAQLSAATSG